MFTMGDRFEEFGNFLVAMLFVFLVAVAAILAWMLA